PRILTLTPKRAAQLRRLELLRGESGYTFRDLLALRAASALLDAGASVRQIKETLAALRRQNPSLVEPLVELRLVLEGDRLLAQSDRVRFDPRSGQLVLALDEGGLEKAANATLVTGLVRPLAPPIEQAETWFERASEWDNDPAHWQDAIEAYRRVVAIDPRYAAAWNNLGLLLHRLGSYDEAEAAYRSALKHDPRCCEARAERGAGAGEGRDADSLNRRRWPGTRARLEDRPEPERRGALRGARQPWHCASRRVRPPRRRRARWPPRVRPARADRPHRGGAGGAARRRARRSVRRSRPRGVRSCRAGRSDRGLQGVREAPDGAPPDPDSTLRDLRRRRPRPPLLSRARRAARHQGGR